MPVYVMLTTLTDEGMKTLKQKPERIKEVDKEVMERFGVKIIAQYAVMGPYDFVNILEAPDNDTIVKMAVELGSRGTIRTLTMPALDVEQLVNDLKELG
ncbi:MAG: GYD domain-containing protein [Aquificaceae bacterium]|nr:GYD domain-containing protein [Aquificaceae bacterium]MDW8294819.1 GYD domain-containing protein [Aquificaceae bacterium]